MELDEFVARSIEGVLKGVQQARSTAANMGDGASVASAHWDQTIEFDVAVTVRESDSAGGKARVTVVGMIDIGGGAEQHALTESVTRVRFKVPVFLPGATLPGPGRARSRTTP